MGVKWLGPRRLGKMAARSDAARQRPPGHPGLQHTLVRPPSDATPPRYCRLSALPDERPNRYAIKASGWTVIDIWPDTEHGPPGCIYGIPVKSLIINRAPRVAGLSPMFPVRIYYESAAYGSAISHRRSSVRARALFKRLARPTIRVE